MKMRDEHCDYIVTSTQTFEPYHLYSVPHSHCHTHLCSSSSSNSIFFTGYQSIQQPPYLTNLMPAMASHSPPTPSLVSATIAFLCVSLLLAHTYPLAAALRNNYYAESCPNAEAIARSTLRGLLLRDSTARSALLRLVFHDCQVFVSPSANLSYCSHLH